MSRKKPDIDFFEYLLDKYNLKGDRQLRRELHDEITRKGYTREELDEEVKAFAIMRGRYSDQ